MCWTFTSRPKGNNATVRYQNRCDFKSHLSRGQSGDKVSLKLATSCSHLPPERVRFCPLKSVFVRFIPNYRDIMEVLAKLNERRKVMQSELTMEQAKELIDTIKRYTKSKQYFFPERKNKISFEVVGDNATGKFIINIDRKGINDKGASYQGRQKGTNIILMRLDINPTAQHINPSDGSKIKGSHLHIYTEEYGIMEVIPFDHDDETLYDLCFEFFKRFNVVNPPITAYQRSLEDTE